MTTCDDISERLPEHVLGTIDGSQELAIRRHLRGCAGCRREMSSLGDGLALFARAAHDRMPPPELEQRVTTVLRDEWRDTPAARAEHRPRWTRIAAAAAALAMVASLGWGTAQTRRADEAALDAASYGRLLEVLGGKDFRVGELRPADGRTLEGSVVVYDSHVDQSWAVVFVRAPGITGRAYATLHAPDGRAVDLWDLRIDHEGDGASWLVTSVDLEPFDRMTVTGADGAPLAEASIGPA